jgi:hypothetical protein
MRNCGIDDDSAKILSQGLAKSSQIMSVDLSFNPIGSTGAAWVTRATGLLSPPPPFISSLCAYVHSPLGDLFFDHFGLSTVPVKSYAVDML